MKQHQDSKAGTVMMRNVLARQKRIQEILKNDRALTSRVTNEENENNKFDKFSKLQKMKN